MKAITLWQPWASAIDLGMKRVETRGWKTSYRGELVICAATRPLDPVGKEVAKRFAIPAMSLGCALCVVELYECIDATIAHAFINDMERLLGNYAVGRWAWRTRDLRKLRVPVPVVGHQRLFELSPEESEAVREQL